MPRTAPATCCSSSAIWRTPTRRLAAMRSLEFAKATDQDIAQVARKLDAEKLRGWLKDKRTPSERLSVYALLLGACGNDADARFLQSLLDDASERTAQRLRWHSRRLHPPAAARGLGLGLALLRDSRSRCRSVWPWRAPSASSTAAQDEGKPENVLKCLDAMISQGELADIAIEDMRRWDIRSRTARHPRPVRQKRLRRSR